MAHDKFILQCLRRRCDAGSLCTHRPKLQAGFRKLKRGQCTAIGLRNLLTSQKPSRLDSLDCAGARPPGLSLLHQSWQRHAKGKGPKARPRDVLRGAPAKRRDGRASAERRQRRQRRTESVATGTGLRFAADLSSSGGPESTRRKAAKPKAASSSGPRPSAETLFWGTAKQAPARAASP